METFYLTEKVSIPLADRFSHFCEELSPDVESILIIVDSHGGDANAAFRMAGKIKEIKDRGVKVTMFALNNLSSAALFIFLRGSRRLIIPSVQAILHLPENPSFSNDDPEMQKGRLLVAGYIASHTGQTVQWVQENDKKILSATQLISLGFADEIVCV
ncbi:ATP-dependent Clp protease proteolytic subunit [Candidatus Nomurabacteria bacterium]|nr:ATP-dependent Clp protease proteolytic subunit [Candidatus Nomurabacteria bacterium]